MGDLKSVRTDLFFHFPYEKLHYRKHTKIFTLIKIFLIFSYNDHEKVR